MLGYYQRIGNTIIQDPLDYKSNVITLSSFAKPKLSLKSQMKQRKSSWHINNSNFI